MTMQNIADAIQLLTANGYKVQKRFNTQDRDLVAKLRLGGKSLEQIAEQVGIHSSVVCRYLAQSGLTDNSAIPWTDERLELLRALRRSGVPSKAIAQRLGVTSNAINLKCSKEGIVSGKRKRTRQC
jgi:hypothetical protein